METYIGFIKSPQDALIIFEACRRNELRRVQRRLSNKERLLIQSGSIFAWDEGEAGMRRWTDGRNWSPSRVLGSFLTYRECENTKKKRSLSDTTYKPNGLIKQSFSICTAANQKLHLISYYSGSDMKKLKKPSSDPSLSHIYIPRGLYPELNPLDTSGGHSATLHNLHESNTTPSLSSSPTPSDDDIDLIPPIFSLQAQDIPYEKLPFTEDQRQLGALYGLLKL